MSDSYANVIKIWGGATETAVDLAGRIESGMLAYCQYEKVAVWKKDATTYKRLTSEEKVAELVSSSANPSAGTRNLNMSDGSGLFVESALGQSSDGKIVLNGLVPSGGIVSRTGFATVVGGNEFPCNTIERKGSSTKLNVKYDTLVGSDGNYSIFSRFEGAEKGVLSINKEGLLTLSSVTKEQILTGGDKAVVTNEVLADAVEYSVTTTLHSVGTGDNIGLFIPNKDIVITNVMTTASGGTTSINIENGGTKIFNTNLSSTWSSHVRSNIPDKPSVSAGSRLLVDVISGGQSTWVTVTAFYKYA